MILADTSAWVEFLRGTDSPVDRRMRHLIANAPDLLVTTDVVHLEVLAGARGESHREQLRRLLARHERLPLSGLEDYEAAADLWASLRREGVTVRSLLDCLIVVVALRTDAALLTTDRDLRMIGSRRPVRFDS